MHVACSAVAHAHAKKTPVPPGMCGFVYLPIISGRRVYFPWDRINCIILKKKCCSVMVKVF